MSEDLITLYEKLVAAGTLLADAMFAERLKAKPVGEKAIEPDNPKPRIIYDKLSALAMGSQIAELVRQGMSYADAMDSVQAGKFVNPK